MEYCEVCQSAFYPHIGCFCKLHGRVPMTHIVNPPVGLSHPLTREDAHLGAVEQ